jgi:hypothetical protein
MSTLTDEIKTFIVMSLARYDTPSEVAQAVKVNFEVEVSRQQVHTYNPEGSQPPASRWRELHAATRAAFVRDMAEIGIVHQAVRLRMLDRMAHRAFALNYYEEAAAFLEQAAKECGGIYDRRKVPLTESVARAPADRQNEARPGPAAA